jgi:hypothetical protein
VGWVHERAATLSMKAQALVDAAMTHKAAAIAASTAALAGGGAATVHSIDGAGTKPRERHAEPGPSRSAPPPRAVGRARSAPAASAEPARRRESGAADAERQATPPTPAPAADPPARAQDGQAPRAAPREPARTEPAPAQPTPDPVDGGEFGP